MNGRVEEDKLHVKYKDGININHIPRDQIWDKMRALLKQANLPKFYNRIPSILGLANYDKGGCKIDYHIYNQIISDFEKMHKIFPKIKSQFNRSYFPSLRYVAYRLMTKHNVTPDWKITTMKTEHKKQALDKIYNDMWIAIDKEEEEELIKFFDIYWCPAGQAVCQDTSTKSMGGVV